VRVYVRAIGQDVPFLGALHVSRVSPNSIMQNVGDLTSDWAAAYGLPVTDYLNQQTMTSPPNTVTSQDRSDLLRSFNFILPYAWAQGSLRFTFSAVGESQQLSTVPCDRCIWGPFQFNPVGPVRI